VDHFKGKNDTYGHEYGDFVLKKVVDVLRGTLRQSDVIIRWGGDEFILVCPRTTVSGAENILGKIVHVINSADPLCVMCAAEGRYTKATVVDHIKPHRGDRKLFWDRANWQPLCKAHHDKKTGLEDSRPTYHF